MAHDDLAACERARSSLNGLSAALTPLALTDTTAYP